MTKKHAMLGLVGSLLLAAPPALATEAKPPLPQQHSGNDPQSDREKRAAEILAGMLDPAVADSMASKQAVPGFGGEMSRIAFENAYVQLWTRPGLSLRDRSLVVISMLIALGNEHELKVHIESGLRNGLTPRELEEIIYQATAYAGFPRASDALAIAKDVLAQGDGKAAKSRR